MERSQRIKYSQDADDHTGDAEPVDSDASVRLGYLGVEGHSNISLNTSGSLLLNLKGTTTPNIDRIPLVPTFGHNQGDSESSSNSLRAGSKELSPGLGVSYYAPINSLPVVSVSGIVGTQSSGNKQSPNRLQQPHQHHTLGQIAAKFQENARAPRTVEEEYNSGVEDDNEEELEEGDDELEDDKDQSTTGRWTRQEHDLFLAGLKKYGKVS
jgi:hypothetical protein